MIAASGFAALHPGYDEAGAVTRVPDRKSRRCATSRFQMNSTTSAPMVEVM